MTGSVGAYLRTLREERGMSLGEVSQTTRIPRHMLEALEEDRHDALPGATFVRGYVHGYARVLGEDPERVLELLDGLERGGERTSVLPAAATGGGPSGANRFGLAIAVTLLLILFSLALSVVLRPREVRVRDLSFNGTAAPSHPKTGHHEHG